MKYFKFFILFITMGIVQGCPDEDDGIVVAKFRLINKTDTPIYVYESISKYEVKINEINYSTIRDININPNQEKVFSLFDGQMDDKEKFYFFIFNDSAINDYSWEEIQEQHLYKKYAFTLEDLNTMNWELEYDGN